MATHDSRILVIDDETQIRRFLSISLRAQGFEVCEADSGRKGIDWLATRGADLVILDLGLPDIDGQDVLKHIRSWSTVPVIVLSVRSDEQEKVAALDAGANDYVTKPFGVLELSARIRANLRAAPTADEGPLFDDGHLRIDMAAHQAFLDGSPLSLSRKEFRLLALLASHAGRVITQPHLLRELWGPAHDEDTHYLRILLGKLRAKLGDSAVHPKYIETEPGVGLRFKAIDANG